MSFVECLCFVVFVFNIFICKQSDIGIAKDIQLICAVEKVIISYCFTVYRHAFVFLAVWSLIRLVIEIVCCVVETIDKFELPVGRRTQGVYFRQLTIMFFLEQDQSGVAMTICRSCCALVARRARFTRICAACAVVIHCAIGACGG